MTKKAPYWFFDVTLSQRYGINTGNIYPLAKATLSTAPAPAVSPTVCESDTARQRDSVELAVAEGPSTSDSSGRTSRGNTLNSSTSNDGATARPVTQNIVSTPDETATSRDTEPSRNDSHIESNVPKPSRNDYATAAANANTPALASASDDTRTSVIAEPARGSRRVSAQHDASASDTESRSQPRSDDDAFTGAGVSSSNTECQPPVGASDLLTDHSAQWVLLNFGLTSRHIQQLGDWLLNIANTAVPDECRRFDAPPNMPGEHLDEESRIMTAKSPNGLTAVVRFYANSGIDAVADVLGFNGRKMLERLNETLQDAQKTFQDIHLQERPSDIVKRCFLLPVLQWHHAHLCLLRDTGFMPMNVPHDGPFDGTYDRLIAMLNEIEQAAQIVRRIQADIRPEVIGRLQQSTLARTAVQLLRELPYACDYNSNSSEPFDPAGYGNSGDMWTTPAVLEARQREKLVKWEEIRQADIDYWNDVDPFVNVAFGDMSWEEYDAHQKAEHDAKMDRIVRSLSLPQTPNLQPLRKSQYHEDIPKLHLDMPAIKDDRVSEACASEGRESYDQWHEETNVSISAPAARWRVAAR